MKDFGWTFSTPLKAGKRTLKLVTAPGQAHELVMLKLVPGKTAKEAAIWAEKPEGPPPFTWAMGVSPMAPGLPNYWSVDLTPGRYALVCFIPDVKDGKPHLLHGMLQEHGPTALRAAFVQSLAAEVFGAEYVAHYLDHDHAPASLIGGVPSERQQELSL